MLNEPLEKMLVLRRFDLHEMSHDVPAKGDHTRPRRHEPCELQTVPKQCGRPRRTLQLVDVVFRFTAWDSAVLHSTGASLCNTSLCGLAAVSHLLSGDAARYLMRVTTAMYGVWSYRVLHDCSGPRVGAHWIAGLLLLNSIQYLKQTRKRPCPARALPGFHEAVHKPISTCSETSE